jgi:hypothetical protein
MGPPLLDHNGLGRTDAVARLAPGAIVLVDKELVPKLHYGVKGAGLFAETAEDAVLGQDPV